jgi:hypothetical protein
MFQMLTRLIKGTALLIASMFLPCAASYEPVVDSILVGAIVFVRRTTQFKEQFWGAGLVAAAVLVSPILLASKISLLTGFTCIAAYLTLRAALQFRPLPGD